MGEERPTAPGSDSAGRPSGGHLFGAAEPPEDAPPAPGSEVPASAREGKHRRRDVDRLRDELDEARKAAAEYLNDLKRLKAEFENYRKRVLKEQTHIVEYASQALVERLLPIVDNFELALIAADRTSDYAALVRGVEMVFGELRELLRKEGLRTIEALGKPFDPEQHEAVLEAGGRQEGEPVVGEVLRPGYTLKGRVVRPAMVKVVRR